MTTPTGLRALRPTFLGRALAVAWDALPRMTPIILLLPVVVFGAASLGLPLPVTGFVVAWLLTIGTRAALRSAVRVGEVEALDIVTLGPCLRRGAALALIPATLILALEIAFVGSEHGAPLAIVMISGGLAAGALVAYLLTWPAIAAGISEGRSVRSAALAGAAFMLTSPRRSAGAAIASAAAAVAGATAGPTALAIALAFLLPLITLILRSPNEGHRQHD